MIIPNVKPGDPTSETSGNAGFLNRLIDGVNSRTKTTRGADTKSRFVSACTFLMRRAFGQDTNRGDVFAGNVNRSTKATDDLLQAQRWLSEDSTDYQNLHAEMGRWFVCAEKQGALAGNWYAAGVFPAYVWFTHWNHRFCDIKNWRDPEIGDGLGPATRPLYSSANGGGRILDRRAAKHAFDDAADRIAEGTYTVTQDDIDDGELFAEYPEGGISTKRPNAYYLATGTAGSVVWEETPVLCLVEKPAFSLPGVGYGELRTVESVFNRTDRAVDLEYDLGSDTTEENEVMYNVDVGGGEIMIYAMTPGVYEVEQRIRIQVGALPASTGVTTVKLESDIALTEQHSFKLHQYSTDEIRLLTTKVMYSLHDVSGASPRFKPRIVISNTSATPTERAEIKILSGKITMRPIRKIYGTFPLA